MKSAHSTYNCSVPALNQPALNCQMSVCSHWYTLMSLLQLNNWPKERI